MKKRMITLAVIVLLASGSYVVFATQPMGGMMQKQDNAKKGMMQMQDGGKKDMMMDMCPMHRMMCKSMMNKQMIAVKDGGVVVLAGNKLIKYDKDLNQVKEMELKIDMEQMEQKMQKMMAQCPMHQKMMGSGKGGSNDRN